MLSIGLGLARQAPVQVIDFCCWFVNGASFILDRSFIIIVVLT